MREDKATTFDLAEFETSCRVMKCARQLFPHSEKQAELWAIYCYDRGTRGSGASPEQMRDSRCPNWKKNLEETSKMDVNLIIPGHGPVKKKMKP